MAYIYNNNLAGTLGANIGPSDTLVLLGSGQGANWPSPQSGNYFYATLVHLTTGAYEVVQVTARSADTLTVVRGRDNTNAMAFVSGSIIEARLNAQALREMDWRNYTNVAGGVAQLDGSTQLPVALVPGSIARVADVANTYIAKIEKNAAGGVAALDGNALIPTGLIPPLQYLPISGGQVTGTIISGVNSGQFAVGGQGQNQASTYFDFAGRMALANSGSPGTFYGIWNAGNFDPNGKLNTSGGTITGGLTVNDTLSALNSIVVRRNGAPNQGLIYFGNGNDYILMNATDWTFSGGKNVYGNDFISTSDRRLKDVRGYISPAPGISKHLKIAEWNMIEGGTYGRGVIAQDVLQYAPQHVVEKGGFYRVNKSSLALDLIYDLAQRVQQLEGKC